MIQKRWIRGLLLMVSVVAMFVLGLLNFMSVADAYHIAIGKKQ